MYGKKAVEKVADIKGVKVRVQATVTEDTLFPAYGAQVVHMPFGEVYTSLQTGVVDMAENGINNYLVNKHYEAGAGALAHRARGQQLPRCSSATRCGRSLTDEQKKWVQAAADEVSQQRAGRGLQARARGAGQAARRSASRSSRPSTRAASRRSASRSRTSWRQDLGPNAVKVLDLVRNVK